MSDRLCMQSSLPACNHKIEINWNFWSALLLVISSDAIKNVVRITVYSFNVPERTIYKVGSELIYYSVKSILSVSLMTTIIVSNCMLQSFAVVLV